MNVVPGLFCTGPSENAAVTDLLKMLVTGETRTSTPENRHLLERHRFTGNVPTHGSPVVSSDLCVRVTKRSRRTKSVTKTYIPMLDSSRFTGLIEENVRYRLQNISFWLQPVGLGSILAYNAHIRYTGNSQLFVYCDTSIPLQIKPTGPEVFRRRCDTNTHDDHDCL